MEKTSIILWDTEARDMVIALATKIIPWQIHRNERWTAWGTNERQIAIFHSEMFNLRWHIKVLLYDKAKGTHKEFEIKNNRDISRFEKEIKKFVGGQI